MQLRAMMSAGLILLPACEYIDKLHALFHPMEDAAGLVVDVTPKKPISIYVDGVRVARESPYTATALAPEEHTIEVRAMGYAPVIRRVTLKNDEVKRVVVRLQSHSVPEEPAPAPPPPKPVQKSAPPPPPEAPAPPLPDGVAPIVLRLRAVPSKEVSLDNVVVEEPLLTLERTHGTLRAGNLTLHYRVGGGGILELSIPQDNAAWRKEARTVAAGDVFRINRGATRVTRIDADGDHQTLIVRRIAPQ